MSLSRALVWWNKTGGVVDHDDVMFIAGYQKAVQDAADLVHSLGSNSTAEAARRIHCLDDLPEDTGN